MLNWFQCLEAWRQLLQKCRPENAMLDPRIFLIEGNKYTLPNLDPSP